MTRHPCGCGIAWLRHGGHQDAAETRPPPVFRRHSANERPGWLLCEMHLRRLECSAVLSDLTSTLTHGPEDVKLETLQAGIARTWAAWGLRSPLHGILS